MSERLDLALAQIERLNAEVTSFSFQHTLDQERIAELTGALDRAWDRINAQGGFASTSEERAYCKAIGEALAIIEEEGGMDPLQRGGKTDPTVSFLPATGTGATGTPDQSSRFALLIEDTRGLSQGVELRDELLASIAISTKKLADMFDNWRRK